MLLAAAQEDGAASPSLSAAFTLGGLRPEAAHPLPAAPLAPDQALEAMRHLAEG